MRLATLNVWGLPWPISREGPARMDAIGARLPELELDWMLFQEVWTQAARRQLIEAGRRAGLVHAWHREVALGGSGLLVLARESFQDQHFEAYTVRGFPQRVWHGDYHSGKGFCALRFALPDGELTLIDTHLHAQYGDDSYNDEYPHRVAQVVQIAAGIVSMSGPVLAAGDFNFSEGRREYQIFTGLTGVRDGAAELDRRQPTTVGANPYRNERLPHDDERIDYVFTRDGEGTRLRVRRIDRIFDEAPPAGGPAAYSDHAGLVAEIELARDPGARPPDPDAAAAELAARELKTGREAALARRDGRRLVSGGALGVAALALAGRRRTGISRRRLLSAGLAGGALIALPFGLGNAALSELAIPDEVRDYQQVEELLPVFQSRALPAR